MASLAESTLPSNVIPPQSQVNYTAFENRSDSIKVWLYLGLGSTVLFFVCIALVIPLANNNGLPGHLLGWATLISIVSMFTCLLTYAFFQHRAEERHFRQFLADNNWQALPYLSNDNVATSLIGVGDDPLIKQAFTGNYSGLTFSAAIYEYTTGSGKSETTHTFMNLYFMLQKAFPLILLDNKSNDYFRVFSDLPSRIPGGKSLQVEGNFNKYFKVTVLPGTEREVLQVLTPDFMSDLVDRSGKTDVEVEADKLFIISHKGSFSKETLSDLFSMAGIVIKNLGELSDTWQASSSKDTVDSIAAAALEPRNKLLLRPKHIGISSLIGIALYVAFTILSNR